MQENTESQAKNGKRHNVFSEVEKMVHLLEQLSRTVARCDYPWLWRTRCVTLFWILVQPIPFF